MLRIHWTVDFIEAHVVAGLIREERIDVWVFDEGMVRIDWLRAIAIGGYRVMVDADDAVRAAPLVAQFLAEPKPFYVDGEMPSCPRCDATDIVEDPWPRRAMFLWVLVGPSCLLAIFMPWATAAGYLVYFALSIIPALPGITGFIVKHRYLCARCARRFRDHRGERFADLSAAATAAEGMQGA